jgi:hypothetical protein
VALIEDVAFLGNLVVLGPVFGVAGAGSAAGALVLARRAEDRTLLGAGENVGTEELPDGEARELPGGGG